MQVRSGLIALGLKLRESGSLFGSFVVGPQQCELVRRFFCPRIHDVVGEVEVLWYYKFQVLVVILNRLERSLF